LGKVARVWKKESAGGQGYGAGEGNPPGRGADRIRHIPCAGKNNGGGERGQRVQTAALAPKVKAADESRANGTKAIVKGDFAMRAGGGRRLALKTDAFGNDDRGEYGEEDNQAGLRRAAASAPQGEKKSGDGSGADAEEAAPDVAPSPKVDAERVFDGLEVALEPVCLVVHRQILQISELLK
jgi:hypothetical protein